MAKEYTLVAKIQVTAICKGIPDDVEVIKSQLIEDIKHEVKTYTSFDDVLVLDAKYFVRDQDETEE